MEINTTETEDRNKIFGPCELLKDEQWKVWAAELGWEESTGTKTYYWTEWGKPGIRSNMDGVFYD